MRPTAGWLWLPFLVVAVAPDTVAGGPEGIPVAYRNLETEGIAAAAAALQEALEQATSRDTRRWRSGSSSGAVTPLRTFQVSDGRYCREFLEVVLASGQEAPAYGKGTACRSRAGLWELIAP
jgi:surface antigen